MTLLGASASAQSEKVEKEDFAVMERVSAGVEFKLNKKWRAKVDEELRMDSEFGMLSKSYTTFHTDYKLFPFLKIGAGYQLIHKMYSDDDDVNAYRTYHRGYGDLTGSMKSGAWKFSVKERFQASYRAGEMNTFQNPRTLTELKSRLKVAYSFKEKDLEPYVEFEERHQFNGVKYSPDYSSISYSDAYMNRLRLSLGTEWALNKKNSLDIYTLWDYNYNKDIDANKKGTYKSMTVRSGFCVSLGVAYTFGL